jgi:hypothetical protein
MSHGGARDNAGRKPKYVDNKGEGLETEVRKVPKILTEKDIQDAVLRKLEKSDKEN